MLFHDVFKYVLLPFVVISLIKALIAIAKGIKKAIRGAKGEAGDDSEEDGEKGSLIFRLDIYRLLFYGTLFTGYITHCLGLWSVNLDAPPNWWPVGAGKDTYGSVFSIVVVLCLIKAIVIFVKEIWRRWERKADGEEPQTNAGATAEGAAPQGSRYRIDPVLRLAIYRLLLWGLVLAVNWERFLQDWGWCLD